VIDEVPTGRMVMVESEGLVEADDDLFRTRRRLMNHGTIVASLVLDADGSVLAEPQLSAWGRSRSSACRLRRVIDDCVVGGGRGA
jgi:mRNA degradation ribonuclease J1/J2